MQISFFKLAIIFIVLVVVPSLAQRPSTDAWFTQIGSWHYKQDSLSGKSFIFHNASLDGAQSGEATSNIRFNRGFEGLVRFSGRISLSQSPACAGLLVQNRKTTFYFLIKKKNTSNSLEICQRSKSGLIPIFTNTVSIKDTIELFLHVKKDSLCLVAGNTSLSIIRPSDFSGTQWVGFECLQGAIKVFNAQISSASGEIKETFEKATFLNLHMEKMFTPVKK